MKIYIFGSCSGTEPMPGRHHTSFAIETDGRYYWFDAGEGCAHTAHVMGVDLLRVSEIFISHTHMDHVGGLPHLLWTIRKLYTRTKKLPVFGDVSVYIPNSDTFDGAITMVKDSRYKSNPIPYQMLCHVVREGVVFKNESVTVSAVPTKHIPEDEYGPQSYAYIFEAEGKRVVYSGDYRDTEELGLFIGDGCDVLLSETGHHDPCETCEYLKTKNVGKNYFVHHGRTILADYDTVLQECRKIIPDIVIVNDRRCRLISPVLFAY